MTKDLNEYLSEKFSDNVSLLDLTDFEYHTGQTLSSGVLPKWVSSKYIVKLGTAGHETDAVNEALTYEVFGKLGANVAQASVITVRFHNNDTSKIEERFAMFSKKFEGEIIYYRDIRKQFRLGNSNDELVDFVGVFPTVAAKLVEMFMIDYVFAESDRHSKNFGITQEGLAPLYDNGACLFYNVPDTVLSAAELDVDTSEKFSGKSTLSHLRESMSWFDVSIGTTADLVSRQTTETTYSLMSRGFYSKKRHDFINDFVTRRLDTLCSLGLL
ncbi:hypothetical protein FACS1894202_13360 [Clostridia bacterium]|nr:hypothetical protein FACS1894202_13360 [Clostridia bacterium]